MHHEIIANVIIASKDNHTGEWNMQCKGVNCGGVYASGQDIEDMVAQHTNMYGDAHIIMYVSDFQFLNLSSLHKEMTVKVG